MKNTSAAYNPKTVLSLILVFVLILFLVYGLASFWHESRKINQEIDAIIIQNQKNLAEIEARKQELEYLETPQRIEKEAKIEARKRRPNEKVLVLIEPSFPFKKNTVPWDKQKSPEENLILLENYNKKSPIEEWINLFSGEKET